MAIHANSIPAPKHTLLRGAAAPSGLLRPVQPAPNAQSELLVILDQGPSPHAFMTRAQRVAMQAGIDALIDYLDAVDPDPDLEDDGDVEPYMSRCETGAGYQPCFDVPGLDECEPDGDSEPDLASVSSAAGARWADQRRWASGGTDEREEENEHGGNILNEPHDHFNEADDADYEPALGSIDRKLDQRAWLRGRGSLEGDFDELLTPEGYTQARHDRLTTAQLNARLLLDRHGLRRPANVGALIQIGPNGVLLGTVA